MFKIMALVLRRMGSIKGQRYYAKKFVLEGKPSLLFDLSLHGVCCWPVMHVKLTATWISSPNTTKLNQPESTTPATAKNKVSRTE